jgi:O-succinylbenzoate synthase
MNPGVDGFYKLKSKRYQHPFLKPIATSHGVWKVREGIILSLTDEIGTIGWGEIAPIPWFGSETLTEAWNFCQQLQEQVSWEEIEKIPGHLFACQFGFESALADLEDAVSQISSVTQVSTKHKGEGEDFKPSYSYLLPAGEDALDAWRSLWERGGRTFKWKIGLQSPEAEIRIFQQLVQLLPAGTKLRLDANGGLSFTEAKQWLKIATQTSLVEFLEQPLPPTQFDRLLELNNEYPNQLALDESVANLLQLENCYQQGWRGVFVIKAAIAGSPKRLRQFCQQHQIDTVFSSVFETKVGRKAALKLAAELSNRDRAVGFGVESW